MIINGGSRSNWRFFASHLMKTTENEHVNVTEIRGLAADTVLEAFREMDALASGTRCKNFFYHANINPREGEKLTEAQWEKAIDGLELNLGLVGCSRFVVEHEKEGRSHRHVIWSRIDPDSMTARPDSNNYRAHEWTARAMEKEFGHAAVAGVHDRQERERPPRRPKNWETFRGHGTGLDPQAIKREVTDLWNRADSGKAFAASLADHGYRLCRGDRRDFCIVDSAGDIHSLARRVEGVKAAEIRARLADLDRDSLPTATEGSANPPQPIAQPGFDVVPQPDDHVHEGSELSTAGPELRTAQPPKTALEAFARQFSAVEAPPDPWSETTPPTTSALEIFATRVTEVMRANHGQPHHRDALVWFERAVIVIDAIQQAADWAKGKWQDLVEHRRGRDQEDDGRDL